MFEAQSPAAFTRIQGRNPLSQALWFFRRWPVIPIIIILAIVVSAVFAEFIAPHDPIESSLRARNVPPIWYAEGSTKYLLGADPLGRDLLSRIIYGSRISLIIAVASVSAGLVIGTTLGLISGYIGGLVDELIMRFVDISLAIPVIMIALVVVMRFGQGFGIIVAVLVLFTWTGYTRQVRAQVLTIRELDYVALARVAGASNLRIMFRHIFPGVVHVLIVIASLNVGSVILAESVLSFLGAGIPPPTPAWGAMVSSGRDFLTDAWWVAFFPGLAILLTVMAMNFLGDWIRDRLDPRLRQID